MSYLTTPPWCHLYPPEAGLCLKEEEEEAEGTGPGLLRPRELPRGPGSLKAQHVRRGQAQHVAAAAAAPLPARPSPCLRAGREGDGAAGLISSSAPRSWGWRAAFRARCCLCSACCRVGPGPGLCGSWQLSPN